jgi:hypothetical protein
VRRGAPLMVPAARRLSAGIVRLESAALA